MCVRRWSVAGVAAPLVSMLLWTGSALASPDLARQKGRGQEAASIGGTRSPEHKFKGLGDTRLRRAVRSWARRQDGYGPNPHLVAVLKAKGLDLTKTLEALLPGHTKTWVRKTTALVRGAAGDHLGGARLTQRQERAGRHLVEVWASDNTGGLGTLIGDLQGSLLQALVDGLNERDGAWRHHVGDDDLVRERFKPGSVLERYLAGFDAATIVDALKRGTAPTDANFARWDARHGRYAWDTIWQTGKYRNPPLWRVLVGNGLHVEFE